MFDLLKEVKDATQIAISGHVRPDGDCVGAVLGLYGYLKKELPKAEISVFLEKPSAVFDDLKGIEDIITEISEEDKNKKFDVFFALDCEGSRLGAAEDVFRNAKKKINIDHHISNPGCGQVNFVDPKASSASELVYLLFDEEKVDEEIARAIYIGIIHDTGVFQYSNTSPRTLQVAAKLIQFGFDFSTIIDKTFYEKTYLQNQILGRALLESIRLLDGKCIFSCVDRKTMEFYGAGSGDLEGIVNQLRIIKGVECAVLIHETEFMEYKVSMRSTDKVDVAGIASVFGGGGHKKAAGCSMSGTAHDVINNLAMYIEKQLKEEDN